MGNYTVQMKLHMEPREGYFLAEFSGKASLEDSINSIDTVFAACREHGAACLLVDVRGIEGSSSVTDRYHLGAHLAKSAMRAVRTALLCREDQWMPDRPLENTAVNRGALLKTTARLDEALAWLGADPATPAGP